MSAISASAPASADRFGRGDPATRAATLPPRGRASQTRTLYGRERHIRRHLGPHNALLVCGALALGILVVYAPVRHFDFVSFDDPLYVTDNPPVESGLTAASVAWAFTTTHAANWHPLTWLSHMTDVELFGLDAGGHHATSVVLHVVATLLLFGVLRTATGAPSASAFVAMAFAFHPLRVESVAWISERKDVLSACFWMLTLAAYVRWARRPTPAGYALVVVAFVLGLLAKPMLVSLPVALLLLDYWPLRRLPAVPRARAVLPLVVEKLPLFLLAMLSAAVTFYAQRAGGAVMALDKVPLSARLANAAVAIWRYIGAIAWPSGLAIYYPYRTWSAWSAWTAAGALVVASGLAVRAAPRHPYVLAGWLWYLVTLLPVIGIVQVGAQSMADRFTYLPQIGISIVIAWGAAEALRGWRRGPVVLAAAAAGLAVAWLAVSARQVGYWRDTETLFARALAVTQDNSLAHLSYGEALARAGRLDEARRHYDEALRLNPASAAAHLNVGNALARDGHAEAAGAQYREAIRLNPNLPEARNSLGLLLARAGKLDEAIAEYRAALAIKSHYPEAHVNLGHALRALGRFDDAVAEYHAALARHPEWSEAHYGLAVSLGSLGDLAAAEREYRETIRLDPSFADAQFGLGLVLAAEGRTPEAIAALRTAVALAPDWPVASEALAWLLATRDDGAVADARDAVALAERARTATGRDDARLLDTLAAAYAANGRFADAAETARHAASVARRAGDDAFAADVEKRLARYETGQPVRSAARVAPR